MESNKLVLLFSGYNDRAVISFARTLTANGVRFAVVARDSTDAIFLSDYASEVVHTRDSNSRQLDRDLIRRVLKDVRNSHPETECLIAPSTEALNRFILREREFLQSNGISVPLAAGELYAAISDKQSFAEICRNSDISVPEEYRSVQSSKYPFVAKPKTYQSEDGGIHTPYLIFDDKQKESFLRECDENQFFYQEFVAGQSIYLLYYFRKDGSVAKLSQENWVQQPQGRSIVAATTSRYHEDAESDRYEALFKSLGFRGLVMVEIKVSDGTAFMIEANPRFWGPSQLFVDAGLNLFEEFLFDHDIILNRPGARENGEARYFWYGGFLGVLRDSDELVYHRGTEHEFRAELDSWIAADVYRRDDTMKIFAEETR
ncbi:MAG: ATP-grasp domain-containing protein [Woeseiaceae bacterium]